MPRSIRRGGHFRLERIDGHPTRSRGKTCWTSPARLVEMTGRPNHPKGSAVGAGVFTPDQLAKFLEQLDPCDFGKGEHDRLSTWH
ncbi:Hypothetical protein BN117_0487 [Bordetella parapertussis Bpp5]|uniref:Uncharacterized protein n=1 Tax=Bordetella parapertussis (strain Bpp5) TaxID=1208660 RepID=K0MCQ2_BORPB|nr:Hypothetical protein BN117_0487 [Bordetella parapertussis Bpp5]